MSTSESFERGRGLLQKVKFDMKNSQQQKFPEFWRLHVEHFFGDVQSRPGLTYRDRMITNITVNILVSVDSKTQLRTKAWLVRNIRSALMLGISREEILEIIMHVMPYSGWPAVVNALQVVKEVFASEQQEKEGASSASKQPEKGKATNDSERLEKGKRILRELDGGEIKGEFIEKLFPEFWRLHVEHLYGDIWSRPALAVRDRIIVSMAAAIALKFNWGLERIMRWALDNGISRQEILEIILQVAHFRGWPFGMNAIEVAKEVLSPDV
jgi:4-carboxymuconolactone decarboxylase